MDTFYIVRGLGLLFIGIAAADVIVVFRKTYKRAKRTKRVPILLDGWGLPRT